MEEESLENAAHPASSLDFLSPEFDSLRALYTPDLVPPVPNVKPLDNVLKCRALLPAEIPESLAHVVAKPPASDAGKTKQQALKKQAENRAERISTSNNMSMKSVAAAVPANSPLSIMASWVASGCRVRVVTRHARGVRGTSVGKLTAYDRFMNVVMQDVEEQYTVMIKVARTKEIETFRPSRVKMEDDPVEDGEVGMERHVREKVRWVRKQDRRSRQLGQVFIKGDNIVLVSAAPAGTELPMLPIRLPPRSEREPQPPNRQLPGTSSFAARSQGHALEPRGMMPDAPEPGAVQTDPGILPASVADSTLPAKAGSESGVIGMVPKPMLRSKTSGETSNVGPSTSTLITSTEHAQSQAFHTEHQPFPMATTRAAVNPVAQGPSPSGMPELFPFASSLHTSSRSLANPLGTTSAPAMGPSLAMPGIPPPHPPSHLFSPTPYPWPPFPPNPPPSGPLYSPPVHRPPYFQPSHLSTTHPLMPHAPQDQPASTTPSLNMNPLRDISQHSVHQPQPHPGIPPPPHPRTEAPHNMNIGIPPPQPPPISDRDKPP